MPYNDIFADHYGVSSVQTISLYRRMYPNYHISIHFASQSH